MTGSQKRSNGVNGDYGVEPCVSNYTDTILRSQPLLTDCSDIEQSVLPWTIRVASAQNITSTGAQP